MNFWNQLASQQITDREQITAYLTQKLGQPANELQTNLLSEIIKKITSYYQEPESQNHTTYSLFGFVQEIQEKKFKEGRRKGQTFYSLKLGEPKGERFRALKEYLTPEKWKQVEKMAILGKNLVFKYKKWITNKDVLDFYPQPKK